MYITGHTDPASVNRRVKRTFSIRDVHRCHMALGSNDRNTELNASQPHSNCVTEPVAHAKRSSNFTSQRGNKHLLLRSDIPPNECGVPSMTELHTNIAKATLSSVLVPVGHREG